METLGPPRWRDAASTAVRCAAELGMALARLRVVALDGTILHRFLTEGGPEFRHFILEVADRECQPFKFLDRVLDLP
jgi:hypothetical protein